jgi:hypothetical protein
MADGLLGWRPRSMARPRAIAGGRSSAARGLRSTSARAPPHRRPSGGHLGGTPLLMGHPLPAVAARGGGALRGWPARTSSGPGPGGPPPSRTPGRRRPRSPGRGGASASMAEARDRRLVGDHVLAQLHPGEAPHRLAVVDRILRLRVREVEPLLEEADPQHPLEIVRLAAHSRVRVVVRHDQGQNPPPRDHGIHLRQEPLPPSHLALLAPRLRRKRPLLAHRIHPPAPALPRQAGLADLP